MGMASLVKLVSDDVPVSVQIKGVPALWGLENKKSTSLNCLLDNGRPIC